MARVQLDLPEQFLYTHTINVRMTDLNTGKHVGNDQMISLLSEARYRFFCHIGFDQFDIADWIDRSFDMADLVVLETAHDV